MPFPESGPPRQGCSAGYAVAPGAGRAIALPILVPPLARQYAFGEPLGDLVMPLRSFVPSVALLTAFNAGSAAGQLDEPFPAILELSSLEASGGSSGFVIKGINQSDQSGKSVSSAGDVNADGVDDLIIGARLGSSGGPARPGASYVVFGGSGVGPSGALELSSLNGVNGFVINGIDDLDNSGWSVSSAGDVNGDGVADLLIGAFTADPNGVSGAGASYVVFGGPGVGSSGALELSSLNGTNGFVINGIDMDDRSGGNVSSLWDVNADGADDLIIGAALADPSGRSAAGESYVVFGGPGVGSSGALELSSLDGTDGFVINGIDTDDSSGGTVSSVGDVNADGVNDVIIGARNADPNGSNLAGESYVVFGGVGVGATGTIELSSLDGTNGFVINGIDAGDQSGNSVSSAGDVNADGVDDLIVGASLANVPDPDDPIAGSNVGESYVVFGGSGVGSSGVLELSSLDGTNGFVIRGIDENDQSGTSVSSAGDVNADGVGDVVIGAPASRINGITNVGRTFVVFGRDLSPPCPADTNGDGLVTPADFNAWVSAFNSGAPGCDQNGDGLCTPADFNAWVLNYNSGC